MANTVADVTLSLSAYTSLYTATGITVGKTVVIQNKSSKNITVQVAGSLPAASSTQGSVVKPLDYIIVDKTPAGVYAIGEGPISCQEY